MEYQIGEFSKITRLSIKTLRYYHEEGILTPSYIDSDSGYRYYNEKSVMVAKVIRELKSLDFAIKDIREIIANCEDDSDIYRYLVSKAKEISAKISMYKNIEVKINSLIKLEEEVSMLNKSDEIQMKQIEDMLFAGIRFKGKYSDVGKRFGAIFKECGRYIAGKPFSMYYDEGFREDDADIEACVPVSKSVERGEVKSRILRGGKVLSLIHRGSYESIGESYKKIYEYVKANKLAVAGPGREIYFKGPGMIFTGNPKKFVTEIQFPIV